MFHAVLVYIYIEPSFMVLDSLTLSFGNSESDNRNFEFSFAHASNLST
jgi:hypothetical protein